MHVFLVHSFNDFKDNEKLSYDRLSTILKKMNSKIKFKYLKGNDNFLSWKYHAKNAIKDSHIIIFISNDAPISKNILWELKKAKKFEKPIVNMSKLKLEFLMDIYEIFLGLDLELKLVLSDIEQCIQNSFRNIEKIKGFIEQGKTRREFLNILHDFHSFEDVSKRFKIKDPYLNELMEADIKKDLHQINEVIVQVEFDEFRIIKENIHNENQELLLEQYKIFIQTSESLMQRRQAINSFYITVNTLMATLFTTLVTLMDLKGIMIGIIGFIISSLGVINSLAWKTVLNSYGKLNRSKIRVISAIEKKLPVSLYDLEWVSINYDLKNGEYKPFTKSEGYTATTFFVFYIIGLISSVSFLVYTFIDFF